MKKLMVTGGMLGFSSTVLIGMLDVGVAWPGILWRASVAALVTGLMFRWLGRVWISCIQQLQEERIAAAKHSKQEQRVTSASND
jgi:hypothetical protein